MSALQWNLDVKQAHMLIKYPSPMFVNTADFVRIDTIGWTIFDPIFVNAKIL